MLSLVDLPSELLDQIFANVCRLDDDKHNLFLAARFSRELYPSVRRCFYENIDLNNGFGKQELGPITKLCDILDAQPGLLSRVRRIKLTWTCYELQNISSQRFYVSKPMLRLLEMVPILEMLELVCLRDTSGFRVMHPALLSDATQRTSLVSCLGQSIPVRHLRHLVFDGFALSFAELRDLATLQALVCLSVPQFLAGPGYDATSDVDNSKVPAKRDCPLTLHLSSEKTSDLVCRVHWRALNSLLTGCEPVGELACSLTRSHDMRRFSPRTFSYGLKPVKSTLRSLRINGCYKNRLLDGSNLDLSTFPCLETIDVPIQCLDILVFQTNGPVGNTSRHDSCKLLPRSLRRLTTRCADTNNCLLGARPLKTAEGSAYVHLEDCKWIIEVVSAKEEFYPNLQSLTLVEPRSNHKILDWDYPLDSICVNPLSDVKLRLRTAGQLALEGGSASAESSVDSVSCNMPLFLYTHLPLPQPIVLERLLE